MPANRALELGVQNAATWKLPPCARKFASGSSNTSESYLPCVSQAMNTFMLRRYSAVEMDSVFAVSL